MEIAPDIFTGLTAADLRGQIIPGCAARWDVSADGRRYVFSLRPGLKWSDGTLLVAQDFVASMQRLLSPDTAAILAYRYDAIANAAAVRHGALPAAKLGVRALTPTAVQFDLQHAEVDFLKLLAVAYVVPGAQIAALGRDWAKPPRQVTNGPYTPVSWAQNGTLLLRRNPHFFGAVNVRAQTVSWAMGIDDATRLRLFQTDALDVAAINDGDALRAAQAQSAAALHSSAYFGAGWLGLNVLRPALRDFRVRRALSLAIDRTLLATRVRAMGEQPWESLVPPAVGDYVAAPPPEYAARSMPQRLALARQLLADAGVSAAKPLRLSGIFSANPLTQRTWIAIAAMWRALGLQFVVRPLESRAYNVALVGRDYDVMDYAPFSVVQSASSFIGRFHSDSILNYSGYRSTEVDALIERAEAQPTMAARVRDYAAAEQRLLADVPVVPLYAGVQHRLVAKRVAGWVDSPAFAAPSQYLNIRS